MRAFTHVTISGKPKATSDSVDDAFLAPWIATGVAGDQDARLFAAAMVSDPALADDLAAARAEQEEVVAMQELLGRPSVRPMLMLFAAIAAEQGAAAQKLTSVCSRGLAFAAHTAIDPRQKRN